jgi:hypothetical protein
MSANINQLLSAGLAEVGKPYIYGDEGPAAFDCSGLMLWTFGRVGISLPRTANAQYHATSPVSSPSPGDLVFWVNSSGVADHVALYLGNDQVLSAPHTGATVHVSPLFEESGHTRTFGRVKGVNTTLGAITAPVVDTVSAGASLVGGWLSGARQIVIEAGLGLAAAALVGLGIWRLASPKIHKQLAEVEETLT